MIKEKYIYNVKETAINVTNSNVDSVRIKNNTKTSLRIYKDGFIGVAGAIGKYNETELENEAMEALKQNIEYPCSPSVDRQEKMDKKSEFIKDEEIVNEVEELLYNLRKNHPDFIFSNKINLTETNTKVSNDEGLNLEYSDKGISIELLFKHKDSSSLFEGFIGTEERKYDRNLLLQESDVILSAFNNKVELPENKTYPVVCYSSMAPMNKLISDLEANVFASGSSLFSDKIGQKVFSEDFTFYQSLNPDDAINIPFFDAEGVVNNEYRYALIEKGVIKTPYTDKKTARKFNLPLTGSSASLYDGVPAVSFINHKIEESQKTLKELLGGEIGIFVMVSSGGDFTSSGDFAAPVQCAFLFDGEKLIGKLPELQLSSNIYDMFGSGFRGVSKDTFLPFSTGKFTVMDLKVSNI
jgi:PmbA protein